MPLYRCWEFKRWCALFEQRPTHARAHSLCLRSGYNHEQGNGCDKWKAWFTTGRQLWQRSCAKF
jgi:hypothetical protein